MLSLWSMHSMSILSEDTSRSDNCCWHASSWCCKVFDSSITCGSVLPSLLAPPSRLSPTSHAVPCIPFCAATLQKNPKYRCSETGYCIPLKCKAPGDGKEADNDQELKNDRLALEVHSESDRHMVSHELGDTISIKNRNLLDESTTGKAGLEYVTYRSCIPAINEEKLSILGFEVIILCLLLASGSFVYFRRKRTMPMPGVAAMRLPTNSRF